MATLEQMTELAETHLRPEQRQAWLEHLRPAAQLVPLVDGEHPAAQIGGRPRLPVGTGWPTWQHGPLGFVAALHCAALHAVAPGLLLPAEGTLLLFYWFDEEDGGALMVLPFEDEYVGGFRSLWVPPGVATEVVEPPGDAYNEELLSARLHQTALGVYDERLTALIGDIDDRGALSDALHELAWAGGASGSQVGGWSEDLQQPPELEVAPQVDPDSDPEQVAADLRLVLQLQEGNGFNFGTGVAYWFARPQDVADGDWSRVWPTWQC